MSELPSVPGSTRRPPPEAAATSTHREPATGPAPAAAATSIAGRELGEVLAAHTGFVFQLARRYRSLGVPLEDLVAAGRLGLVEAARRYDAAHGARFITYAAFWIRKAILDALDAQASVVRIPSYQRRQGRANGASPATYFVTTVSLDEPCGEDPGNTLAARLPDTASPDPVSEVQRSQHVARLRAALDHLPARDRYVVVRSYGLDGEPAWSREKVGRVVGLSRERVRQIESAALERLRRAIARPARRPAPGAAQPTATTPAAASTAMPCPGGSPRPRASRNP